MPKSETGTEVSDGPPPATHHALGLPQPPSVSGISSTRLTDMTSEDGERSQSQPGRSTSQRRQRAPPTRNSEASQVASRPGTANSRLSRMHIPSLTAQAFFRPMSSQRLQARRGRGMTYNDQQQQQWATSNNNARRRSMTSSSTYQHGSSFPRTDQSSQNRRSFTSNGTIPHQGSTPNVDTDNMPPSRGTGSEHTDSAAEWGAALHGRGKNSTPARNLGHNMKLLQDREKHAMPTTTASSMSKPQLELGVDYKTALGRDPPQRAPVTFFSLQNSTAAVHEDDMEQLTSPRSAPSSNGFGDEKAARTLPSSEGGKNYEHFTGNTIFCLGGRLQNSRDKPFNVITAILIILPSGLFFGYSAPWLWHHISPAIPIVYAYLFYVCMSSFIHASVVDPGVMPRNLQPQHDYSDDPLAVGPSTTEWVMVKLATSEVAAMDVPVKYCKTCNIWRPPRCYHCRVCDNCVETLDHHCLWLNNCVGRRNYRYFFSFVASTTILSLYLIGASLAHVLSYRSRENISFHMAVNTWRSPWAMVIYGAVGFCYPASLVIYHLFLSGRGETTRENLNSHKFAKSDRHRPFTQGSIFANWTSVMLRPRPPTYLQYEKKYEPGDQRLSPLKRGHRVQAEAHADIEMQHVGA